VRIVNSNLLISPRDLIAELECSHRLHLDWAVIKNLLPAPDDDETPEQKLSRAHGLAHEAACVDPGPSIKLCPFGQVVHSKIQTSYISFSLIEGIEVSSPVSRIARDGTEVVSFLTFA